MFIKVIRRLLLSAYEVEVMADYSFIALNAVLGDWMAIYSTAVYSSIPSLSLRIMDDAS